MIGPGKIATGFAVAAGLVLAGLAAGWTTRGWHDDARTLKAQTSGVQRLVTQFGQVVTANNALADTILSANKATDRMVGGMVTALGVQSHVFTQLRLDITRLPVGTCQFTPAADGLFQRAYRASFPADDHPAAAPAASGGDATPR